MKRLDIKACMKALVTRSRLVLMRSYRVSICTGTRTLSTLFWCMRDVRGTLMCVHMYEGSTPLHSKSRLGDTVEYRGMRTILVPTFTTGMYRAVVVVPVCRTLSSELS